MIAESQLDIWASQGPTSQFTDTYARVRSNLLDSGAPYPLPNTSVFLQGSYNNSTNVYGDSDVDIVLCHTGAYYKDISRLSPQEQQAYNQLTAGVVSYGYGDFKRHATNYISRLYNNVNTGKKALFIPGGNSGRRNVDVLIASQFRRYYEFRSAQIARFDEGICFLTPEGSLVENFPKQHSENCTIKHQNTKSYFKPLVRIFKNMRNTLVAKGLIGGGVAPSYFIEGMLYNVPNDRFGGTYQRTWIECFNHIVTAKRDNLVCANNMFWLVRDNTPTSWPVANFNAFTAGLKNYWES